MPQAEIILEVLAEGGRIVLEGVPIEDGWHFRKKTDESALDFIEDVNPSSTVRTADSWDDALKLIDRYPWHRLVPRVIHPDFRQRILAVVVERYRMEKAADSPRLERWLKLCNAR